jgi:glutamate-1-semialdehyde 2,1-aminomutase/spore coat polysaccharide biosynthesis protein SpsF
VSNFSGSPEAGCREVIPAGAGIGCAAGETMRLDNAADWYTVVQCFVFRITGAAPQASRVFWAANSVIMEQTISAKTERKLELSKAWLKRAAQVIPGCAQTFSKGPSSFVQGIAPNFLSMAKGPYVWDMDGNRYIDYISGLGSIILGHCHPVVQEAVREQLQLGISYCLPHRVEVELAELLCELAPCAEMVRFGKNGSDATTAAVRVARAFTGRDMAARCGYHGWQDWYIGSTDRNLGVPEAVRRLTVSFPYNDLDAVRSLFKSHQGKIACVIMEPVAFEMPKDGFLDGVKGLCQEFGALLVFDEIVTGFRVSLGGAQEHFGVTPDLACFGKGMANGFPLSAIVGRADVMRCFNDVFFSTTHGGEAVSLAASLATLREAKRSNVIGHLWRMGRRLQEKTNEIIKSAGLTECVACVGLPSWTCLRFRNEQGKESHAVRSLFQQEVIKRGLLTHGSHMITLAHDESVVEDTLRIYQEVFEVLADAVQCGNVEQRLAGPVLQPVLRQA